MFKVISKRNSSKWQISVLIRQSRDNFLTYFPTTGGPTFSFDANTAGDIDGLGRLVSADETIGATSYSLTEVLQN